MKVSKYPLFTQKNDPSDAEVVSHRLMVRAGFIRQQSSGQYTLMPMGMRVLKKIESIVRNRMIEIGCSEVLMPAVQPSDLWIQSGRWDDYGPELLRLKDRHQRDYCLGPTFEEVITDLVKKDLNSYKQLPINLFQISSKFRDEIRPRFGLMRAREFIMKDAYSFHLDRSCLDDTYLEYKNAYKKIFDEICLDYTIVDADSGNIGGSESHEFHVLAKTGEDDLLIDENGNGMNLEIAKDKYNNDDIATIKDKNNLTHKKGIEVGHIFKLGTKYSSSMGLSILDSKSNNQIIQMGCYGIGVSRIMSAAIEQCHDDNGIIWPKSIAPFELVIVEIDGNKNHDVSEYSNLIYQECLKENCDVVLDNRDVKLGTKLNDWELIGVPYIVIIGKTETKEKNITLKLRSSGGKNTLSFKELINTLKN